MSACNARLGESSENIGPISVHISAPRTASGRLIIISHVFNFTENKENKLITSSFLEDNQGVRCMKHSKTKANLVQYCIGEFIGVSPETENTSLTCRHEEKKPNKTGFKTSFRQAV